MPEWLEFEELAGRWWHRWASSATSYPTHAEAAVEFETLRDALAVYFRALGGPTGITLTTSRATGQDHRLSWRQRLGLDQEPMELARLDAEHLILPQRNALFPDPERNRLLYFWQTAFLAFSRLPPATPDPLQRDLLYLAASAEALQALLREFPGWRARYAELAAGLIRLRPSRRLPPAEDAVEQVILRLLGKSVELDQRATDLYRAVTDNPGIIRDFRAPSGYRPPLPVPLWPAATAGAGTDSGAERDDDEEEAGGDATEVGEQMFHAHRRRLDQTERDDPLMLNPFEKIISWAEMVNVNRSVEDDDEDEARQAAEGLDQLTLSKHRKKAATRLKMGLEVASAAVPETALQSDVTWPEWHYGRRRYLPDFCAVQVLEPGLAGEDWSPDTGTRARIRQVRRQFEALRPRRELLRAQLDGDEFDTDALVRMVTERAAGHSGSERIYSAWRDTSRDLAVATLVDVSLSTDSWLDDRRVIDIEKEALLVLANGIDACGDEQAVYSFTSHRRKRVEITPLKRFDEPMDHGIERRIAALEPGRYTRMGTAIRHVAAELAERSNRHRLLLVLTDGKPNDTDHYEGRYAIEDTRMAVREARLHGLVVFGVTIDARARQYFPLIFGRSGYAIVPRAAALATALPAIYRQLVQR
ncbi:MULTISPECIES: nitric oxide reductase activation protein NorD [unclassified Wenzhouxiangella]|uniref:nitric oxide reductase activation protein NorD n=1 Tax=unclassified Wenzhouxiangella TaxID=2613841 RepID=UPI000E32C5E8|nr:MULTISPECIES: VWA domain-containing protein [unclassified Wenzhouxiangella]RFF28017.1 VWA domain-containing protein [Wenzhouxiangella sp. 15181]RFP68604.1 VWA domain-containing protein [Wenzhouxiangella sp. 15190]